MICSLCTKKIDNKNVKDGTDFYKSERKEIDDFNLPETAHICSECAKTQIIKLKEKYIYGPMVETLSKKCNNTDIAAILQAFTKKHRYLQFEMFNALILFIKEISKLDENMFFDPRNAWIKEVSKKISDII